MLADTGGDSAIIEFVRATPYGDKVGHVFLFGLLTLVTNLALRFKTFDMLGVPLYFGTGLVITFVVLEEISQLFISVRTFDIRDLFADSLGILFFTYATRILEAKHLTKSSSKDAASGAS